MYSIKEKECIYNDHIQCENAELCSCCSNNPFKRDLTAIILAQRSSNTKKAIQIGMFDERKD